MTQARRELFLTRRFEKDLKRIPREVVKEADVLVQQLTIEPLPEGVRKLSHPGAQALYRIRLREYRLIYAFDATSVVLHHIAHRKDVYKSLKRKK